MSWLINMGFKLLEPYEGKLSRTVLRGESGRNPADLPDKAIASPLMANYILYLYKTMRKFWGEPIVVTQELNDIIGNAVIKDSILASSDTICLLDQSKYKGNYAEVAKLLALSEVEQRKIFTINALDNKAGRGKFKEVYIKRGSTGEVYGVEVSVFQYLTFTTEKPEKTAVESYVSRYGSYRQGLESFISDMKSSELSLPDFVRKVNAMAYNQNIES